MVICMFLCNGSEVNDGGGLQWKGAAFGFDWLFMALIIVNG